MDTALAAAETALGTAGQLADRAVSVVDPEAAARRQRVRARYDGARTTKQRRPSRDGKTGDVHARRDGHTLRAQARNLERNHDIVRGALNVMVRNIVGAQGIGIEPQPRNSNDDINDDFARKLLNLWREWSAHPEVTRTMDWVEAQQLACRSWLRDGEVFAQVVRSTARNAPHATRLPLSLELLESDICPLDYNRDRPLIRGGVEANAWGRPLAYHVYKVHPGADEPLPIEDLKRVPAANMLHLALRERISQRRGVSVLASSITRFDDIKDYEEAERIAARVSARIAAYIKRDPGMEWGPADDGDAEKRDPQLYPGAFLTQLEPGEEINTVSPNRPNNALEAFRTGQLRAAAAGLDMSYSSLARDYDGTYSAQRQELVEGWAANQVMTARFVAHFVQPIWQQFVATAIASGLVTPPPGVRPETYAQAEFRGPAMPWIDPLKEGQAIRLISRTGVKSLTQQISERGSRMQDVFEQLARERRLASELGIQLEADPANPALPAATVNDPNAEPAPADSGDGEGSGADNAAGKRAPRKRAARKSPDSKQRSNQ